MHLNHMFSLQKDTCVRQIKSTTTSGKPSLLSNTREENINFSYKCDSGRVQKEEG